MSLFKGNYNVINSYVWSYSSLFDAISRKYGFLQKDLNTIISALNRLDSSKKRVFVTVIPVKTSKIKNKISLQSIIKTDQNIVLQPEFTGPISNIKVVEGQSVNKGDVLMIDNVRFMHGRRQYNKNDKRQIAIAQTL